MSLHVWQYLSILGIKTPSCLKLVTLDDLDLKASLCCFKERSLFVCLLRYICDFWPLDFVSDNPRIRYDKQKLWYVTHAWATLFYILWLKASCVCFGLIPLYFWKPVPEKSRIPHDDTRHIVFRFPPSFKLAMILGVCRIVAIQGDFHIAYIVACGSNSLNLQDDWN